VLVCIAPDPGIRLRDIGERVGITERAAHRIVTELTTAGYITRSEQDAGTSTRLTPTSQSPTPSRASRTPASCSGEGVRFSV
jgi:DNA-binding IclR family transcriptional regulator